MAQPGGFHRPIPAAKREWKTKNGRVNFITPGSMGEDPDMSFDGERTLRLMTTRGDDQFNTTVYGMDDRFRGVYKTRDVILMNRDDMTRLGIAEDQTLSVTTVSNDGVARSIDGLRAHAFDIPAGCAMGYYPECNPLIPLAHHAKRSKVPAAKAVAVRVRPLQR